MAIQTKLVHLVLLLLLILHLNPELKVSKGFLFADAVPSDNIQSRKVLYNFGGKKVVFNIEEEKENGLLGKNVDKLEELRRVPAGPDPLHHNGSGPKKPKISP